MYMLDLIGRDIPMLSYILELGRLVLSEAANEMPPCSDPGLLDSFVSLSHSRGLEERSKVV